MCRWWSIC